MSGNRKRSMSGAKRQPHQKPPPEKRKPRREQKSNWLSALFEAVIKASLYLLAGSCIVELIAYHVGNITLVVTTVCSCLFGLLTAVLGDFFKPSKDDERPEEDDGLFDRLAMGLRNMGRRIWDNTKLTVLFVFAAGLLGSTVLAANHTVGHVLNAAVDMVKQLTSYEERAVNPDNTPDFSDAPDAPPESSIPAEEFPSEMPEVQPYDTVPSKYVILLDPDRIRELSDLDRRKLYYFAGKYEAKEEESDEAVYSAVSVRVADLVKEEQVDKFNQTEEDDKNRTSAMEASDKEKKMKTSEDLDDIIRTREIVYKEAPGAEIAKLIAENYNGYSLAYYSIGGSKKTIEYYWNESLIWYHNCLTFQGSLEDISNILRRIGARYQDLALIQNAGSDEQIRALKLSKAYSSLSEYSQLT